MLRQFGGTSAPQVFESGTDLFLNLLNFEAGGHTHHFLPRQLKNGQLCEAEKLLTAAHAGHISALISLWLLSKY